VSAGATKGVRQRTIDLNQEIAIEFPFAGQHKLPLNMSNFHLLRSPKKHIAS